MNQKQSHIRRLAKQLTISITSINKEFIKPRSRYKTLFKILIAIIALNFLFRILSLNERVRKTLAPTIKNISRVTGLKYETTRRYVRLLREYGIVKEAFYMERTGKVYILQSAYVNGVKIEFLDVPSTLDMLSELSVQIGLIVECDPELKFRVFRFWKGALEIVYDVISEIYDIIKEKSKSIVRQLRLHDFLLQIKYYISSLGQGELDYIELSKDIKALSKSIREFLSKQITVSRIKVMNTSI